MAKDIPLEILENFIVEAADAVFATDFMNRLKSLSQTRVTSASVTLKGSALPFAQVCSAWRSIVLNSKRFKVVIINLSGSNHYDTGIDEVGEVLSANPSCAVDIRMFGGPPDSEIRKLSLLKAVSSPTHDWRSLDLTNSKSSWFISYLSKEEQQNARMDIDGEGEIQIADRLRRSLRSLAFLSVTEPASEAIDLNLLGSLLERIPNLKGLSLTFGFNGSEAATEALAGAYLNSRNGSQPITGIDQYSATGTANNCLFPLCFMSGAIMKSIKLDISAKSTRFPTWFGPDPTRPSPTTLELAFACPFVLPLLACLSISTTRSIDITFRPLESNDGSGNSIPYPEDGSNKTILLPRLLTLTLKDVLYGSDIALLLRMDAPNLEALTIHHFNQTGAPNRFRGRFLSHYPTSDASSSPSDILASWESCLF